MIANRARRPWIYQPWLLLTIQALHMGVAVYHHARLRKFVGKREVVKLDIMQLVAVFHRYLATLNVHQRNIIEFLQLSCGVVPPGAATVIVTENGDHDIALRSESVQCPGAHDVAGMDHHVAVIDNCAHTFIDVTMRIRNDRDAYVSVFSKIKSTNGLFVHAG